MSREISIDIINKNKELVEKYPFLKPLDEYTGKELKNYDYSFTYLDDMPKGWRKAFGELLCEDIKKVLIDKNMLNDYQVIQVKEKYGSLRWYDSGAPQEINDIIHKYEHISEFVCVKCGKVNVPIFNDGWISPWCEDCYSEYFKKLNTKKTLNDFKVSEPELTINFKIKKFSKDCEEIINYDCSDILKRMNVDISTLNIE